MPAAGPGAVGQGGGAGEGTGAAGQEGQEQQRDQQQQEQQQEQGQPAKKASRSARRKAMKRMLRRTGVLPYGGGGCRAAGTCLLACGLRANVTAQHWIEAQTRFIHRGYANLYCTQALNAPSGV